MHARWFAPLLSRPIGATLFLREQFPGIVFHLEKRVVRGGKMFRWIRFDLDGKTILRARAVVNLEKSAPAISKSLRATDRPLGEIVRKFHVKRTRLKTTTRTRSFHFLGDLDAHVWERFYLLPPAREGKRE